VFGAIFKPRPYPVFVLLAVICGFLGVFLMRASRTAGYAVIVVGVVLLISFIRGLMADLSIKRVGILTAALERRGSGSLESGRQWQSAISP
jgi:H+/Cl- antiporter ClcA